MSIPVKQLISVTPSVSNGGGVGETLNGVILSEYPFLPVGTPLSFPSLAAVLAFFGNYACQFTATCVGTVLTVTQTLSGALAVGQQMSAALAGKVTVDQALATGQTAADREMKKAGYYK